MLHLIPLLPFAGFLINASLGRRLSKTVSGLLATGAMAFSFGIAAHATLPDTAFDTRFPRKALIRKPANGASGISSSM